MQDLTVLVRVWCILGALLQHTVSGQRLVVSSGTIVTSSSTHKTWIPDFAVDGDARTDPNMCNCCAATDFDWQPWYEVDLGKTYTLRRIRVRGRLDSQSLENMEIRLGQLNSGGDVLVSGTADVQDYNHILTTPRSARYLTLTLRGINCPGLNYGEGCTQSCGHCLNGAKCDSVDGTCTSCAAGYKGNKCDTECQGNTYGPGCTQTCSGNCYNNVICDVVDGRCASCAPGYAGYTCHSACNDGYFGPDCNRQCHCEGDPCDKATGVCPSGNCEPGYQSTTCEIQCQGNTYGPGCTQTCSGNCYNNVRCDVVDGRCASCAPGYTGYTCHSDNTYGLDCANKCIGHCLNNARCDVVNGECSFGCAPGYTGYTCHLPCNDGYFGPGCNRQCHCEGDPCDKATGVCPSGNCEPGYQSTTCEIPCVNSYGINCGNPCGSCLGGVACNPVNGKCNSCAAGFMGEKCDQECTDGTYGTDCQHTCKYCLNQAPCNKVDGSCTYCPPGYTGEKCGSQCGNGYYGQGCLEQCGKCVGGECNHINGSCPSGCMSGFVGALCKSTCPDGFYGDGCVFVCGNCINKQTCDSLTGVCVDGCDPGYNDSFCKEECAKGKYGSNCASTCGKCAGSSMCQFDTGVCSDGCQPGFKDNICQTVCDDGTYGIGCAITCGKCLNSSVCDKGNGTCPSTLCEAGFEGHACQLAVREPSPGSRLGGPIGGAAGGLAAIIVIIIVIVLVRRRKGQSIAKNSKEPFFPDTQQPVATESVAQEMHKPKAAPKPRKVSTKENVTVKDSATEDIYYEFLAKKTDLKLCQLWDYIILKKKEENLLFFQEYNLLPNGLKQPHDVAMKPKNRGKNRYRGLCAYDHTRVPLIIEEVGEVDYINASFIDGFEKQKKFIASQGPIKTMIDDFWRMVWQQKSKSIVMLTNIMEKGTEKCILYWPKSKDEEDVTHGKVTIKLISEDKTTDYTIRQLQLSKVGEDTNLPVTQFHFQAWPDKSTPDSTWSLVKFWLKVTEDTSRIPDSGPIVVHCSAGIGRTGTFIAMDNAYYQAKRTGTLKMLDIAQSLRTQRVNMVQTKEQYVYVHEAVADIFHFGTHFIWTNQFEEVYEYLSESDIGSRVTRMQAQYELIVESLADRKSVRVTDGEDNLYGNIVIQPRPNSVPVDDYRPKSKSLVYVQEARALILQNHEENDAFIICKSPGEARITEFWSLIKEQNVKVIISLTDVSLSSSRKSSTLGLGNKAVQQMFGLSLVEERKTSSFQEKKLKLTDSDDSHEVSHFEYNNWASGANIPKDTSSMIQLADAIMDRQPRLSATEPILVYCTNGVKRSGLMCVLLSEINRINREGGHVNIIHTVKTMKERNEDIVGNFDQYQYIYDVILSRIRDSTYQNQG